MFNKLMRNAIAVIMLFFTALNVNAQTFQISGKVTNADEEALVGASIILLPTKTGAVTDVDGDYKINQLNSGKYQLKVSYVGYKAIEKSVQLDADKVINFTLEQDDLLKEEVVVRAIRADKLAPITQQTLSSKEINKVFNGQDGAFVLEQLTPSIQVNSDAGTRFTNYGSMRLRGIDQKRINITFNGVPLNDMMDQGVYFSNFTDITRSIESVQVQRGVGTSTNGTASYAGSISYESENIKTASPEANISLLGGSFNTWQGAVEVKTGLMENNTAFYTRLSKTYSDGYRYHSGTDSYSFFFSGGWFGEKDIVKINGFNGRTKNDLAYSAVEASLAANDPRTNVDNPNDIDDFGQSLLQLEYTHLFNRNTSLTSSVYYGAAGGDFPYTYEADSATLASINYPLYNDHYGVMSYINQNIGDFEWSAGVHAYTFLRENKEQLIPNYTQPYYSDNSTKNEISGFAKATYNFGRLSILADLQARYVSLNMEVDPRYVPAGSSIPQYEWTFLNPKIGATYEFSNQFNAYLSFGRSGREPNRGDYLGSTQINEGNIGNLQNQGFVKPEFVNDYEAGIRYSSENLRFNLNGFYMDFENEIAPIGAYNGLYFVQIYKNQEESYRTGLEADWSYNLSPAIEISGNATLMKSIISSYSPEGSTEEFEDIKTPYSPEIFSNLMVSYQPIKEFGIRVHGRYVGESYTELTNDESYTLSSYFVFNTKLYSDIGKNYRLELDVNNLLNQIYYTDGGPVDNGMGYFVQAPTHFYFTFMANF